MQEMNGWNLKFLLVCVLRYLRIECSIKKHFHDT